jgi:hypothetical protein
MCCKEEHRGDMRKEKKRWKRRVTVRVSLGCFVAGDGFIDNGRGVTSNSCPMTSQRGASLDTPFDQQETRQAARTHRSQSRKWIRLLSKREMMNQPGRRVGEAYS